MPDNLPPFQANPSLRLESLEHTFGEQDLAGASGPSAVAAVAGVLAETQIESIAVAGDGGRASDRFAPLVAPGDAVIVAGENSHQPGSGGKGFHEGDVLASIFAFVAVGAVGTPAVCLCGEGHVVVDAGLAVWVDVLLGLEGFARVDGFVDEG